VAPPGGEQLQSKLQLNSGASVRNVLKSPLFILLNITIFSTSCKEYHAKDCILYSVFYIKDFSMNMPETMLYFGKILEEKNLNLSTAPEFIILWEEYFSIPNQEL